MRLAITLCGIGLGIAAACRHAGAAPALPARTMYPDLAAAVRALIPADARVVGFGELHARTDRQRARSTLAAFTHDGLPAIVDRLSDLVVETWIVDPKCGEHAQHATAQIEGAVARPAATKSEIEQLAEAARAAGTQPHAMTLTCADYARIVPESAGYGSGSGGFDAEAMLTLETRELTRIATSAVHHRDREPKHRPLIALYGGALHNDRFPAAGTAEWSYAAAVDDATANHFIEIDLIVPELAAADTQSRSQPWFPLVAAAGAEVQVWARGERSYVVILPAAR